MTASTASASSFRYQAQEAAKAAEVLPGFVSQLVELEIVPPDENGTFSAGDVRRIRLLRTLDRAGLPLDGVAEVVRRHELSLDFYDLPSYERLSATTEDTFEEVAEETNVPLDLLLKLREAMGSGEPTPRDRVREHERPVIRLMQAQVAEGINPKAIERWLRVYGDSLRRIAETEGHWWHTEVEQPLLDGGMTPTEMLLAAEMAPRSGSRPTWTRRSSACITGTRSMPGRRTSWMASSPCSRKPVSTVACKSRRRSASWTSPGTRS
jgi:DNA-binding transcriptional MerR regulator